MPPNIGATLPSETLADEAADDDAVEVGEEKSKGDETCFVVAHTYTYTH